ncbi:carbohydrate porin [Vibrio europaeus]|uniref:carbohydrate porin n=1 Tax=Vibrio europaeus TaxID=300876 RepID=UPI00233F0C50|nr:carbohydrate porin [Vibrio europaeus]MDC5854876.1 carbohydrate porin [Vibrio europaeus]
MSEHLLSTSKSLAVCVTASALCLSSEGNASEPKPISLTGDYYVFGLASNETFSNKDNSAASGIARVTVDWLAYQNESDSDTGSLRLRVDHKHSYTDDSPSKFMMANVGGFGLIQPAFSDIGLRLTNLYWKQEFNTQDTEMMVGFLDSTDYIDTYALGNPYSGFSNIQFSTGSGSIAIPDESTLGVSLRHMMSKNYYAYLSFSDAKADSTEPFDGLENFFRDNQYFKSLEIGWVPSKESFYMQNSHLTVWHSDGAKAQPSENYGANWSTIYNTGSWVPFFRAGVAKGPEALYKSSVVAGTGYLGLGPGTLGFALGWAKPNAPFDDTYNSELYYRMKFGPISVTPNIQYLNSLPFKTQSDSAWVFGIRGNIKMSI